MKNEEIAALGLNYDKLEEAFDSMCVEREARGDVFEQSVTLEELKNIFFPEQPSAITEDDFWDICSFSFNYVPSASVNIFQVPDTNIYTLAITDKKNSSLHMKNEGVESGAA